MSDYKATLEAIVAKADALKESEFSKESRSGDSDDANVHEWFGGNMDDAYQGGLRDGEYYGIQDMADIARKSLGIPIPTR